MGNIFQSGINAITKTVSGRDAYIDKEGLAAEYADTRLAIPANAWHGSLSELEAAISSEADSCQTWVSAKGIAVSGARDVCKNKIQAAYAPVLAKLQEEAYNEESIVKKLAIYGNAGTIVIIAIVMIVLLVIVYLY